MVLGEDSNKDHIKTKFVKRLGKPHNNKVLRDCSLTLGELRSATCSLETVLLSLLHSGVTSEEASSLENRAQLIGVLQQSSGNTVTDSTSLTCYTTTCNCADDIELLNCICKCEGLTNDELESLKTEVIVNASAVNCDRTAAGIYSYTSCRVLSSAGSVVVRFRFVHIQSPP